MPEIKESHALIKCPHCGGQVRVRARTLGDKTVQQAVEETKAEQGWVAQVWESFDAIFDAVFGKIK